MSESDGRVVVVGQIAGAHGIKGWVKVISFTEPRSNLFDYSPWLIDQEGEWIEFDDIVGRAQGRSWIAKLPGCNDRNATRAFRNKQVAVARGQLPPVEDGEYYWVDLVGLKVMTTKEVPLGHVASVFATGANDVIVVEDVEKKYLIPFVMEQVVQKVDLVNTTMVVDWDPDFCE